MTIKQRRPPGAVSFDDPRTAHEAAEALLDPPTLAGLRRLQKVLCEVTRAQIVRALGAGPLSVQDLAQLLDRPQSATSQHLRVLRAMDVVEVQRRGRRGYYRLAKGPMAEAAVRVLADVAEPN